MTQSYQIKAIGQLNHPRLREIKIVNPANFYNTYYAVN